MNNNNTLLEELKSYFKDKEEKDLRKSVLLCISILIEIQFKKNINNVMIQTYSKYRENGLLNDLKDIKN